MSAEDLVFTLDDKYGVSHTYVVSPHGFKDGAVVMNALIQLGLGPLAEAFFAAAGSGQDEMPLGEILALIDRENVVKTVSAGLVSSGGLETLAPLLLKFTSREGVMLNTDAARDAAFMRNWSEAMSALRKVLEVNGFFDALVGFISV